MKLHPDYRLPAFLAVLTLLAILGHYAAQPAQKVVEEQLTILEQCAVTLGSDVQPAGVYGDVRITCEPRLQNAAWTITVKDSQMSETTLSDYSGSLAYYSSRSLLPTGSTALCVQIVNMVNNTEVKICEHSGS